MKLFSFIGRRKRKIKSLEHKLQLKINRIESLRKEVDRLYADIYNLVDYPKTKESVETRIIYLNKQLESMNFWDDKKTVREPVLILSKEAKEAYEKAAKDYAEGRVKYKST